MIRVKRGVCKRARHAKWLDRAKGYFSRSSTCYTISRSRAEMGYQHAYKDRKIFKRTQRSLWIARLNAFARALGMNYSRLIDGAKKIGLSWNRKTLSEFAVNSYMNSDGGFEKLVAKIREAGA